MMKLKRHIMTNNVKECKPKGNMIVNKDTGVNTYNACNKTFRKIKCQNMNVLPAIKWLVRKQTLNSATHKQCANVHSIEDFLFVCFKRCYSSFPYSGCYFTKRCTIKRNSFNTQNKDFLALNIKQH